MALQQTAEPHKGSTVFLSVKRAVLPLEIVEQIIHCHLVLHCG